MEPRETIGTAWQVASFWLGLLTLASGPIIAAELVGEVNGGLQRAAMWAPLLWITLVSWKLRSSPQLSARSPAS